MFCCALYFRFAVIVAMAAFVTADFIRTEDIVAPDSPAALSAAVGALWPIVIIGVTELALTAWLAPGRRVH